MSSDRSKPGWLLLSISAVLCGCNHSPQATSREPSIAAPPDLTTPAVDAGGSTPAPEARLELRDDDWFEDVTERTGIRFAHHNGREANRYFLIESFGGGAAAVDYDLDGDVDLLLTGGGTISASPAAPVVKGLPPALYRNQGNWQFVSADRAWYADPPDYTFGCTAVDFDADGFLDLFLYCYGRSRLYHNLGDGTFREADPVSQFSTVGMWTAAVWGDGDGDGLPDLFLARYADWTPDTDVPCFTRTGDRGLCGPSKYAGSSAAFLRNRGDGGLDDWTAKIGLQGGVKGLGLLSGDFDGDRRVDFFLANDETGNHLYWGAPDGTLTEDAWRAGVAAGELGLEEGSMGVDAGDVGGDGRIDLWVVNYESEDDSLYCGVEDRLFEHATVRMGLAGHTRMGVGWGTALTDFDGDGWLDILVLNGHALYAGHESPFLQAPQLFQNQGGLRFADVSDQGGAYFRQTHPARGCAIADLDNDGAPDFVAVHLNDPVRVLRNVQPPSRFLSIRLRATHGDRDAIGARVTLTAGKGRQSARFVVRGSSYASHSDDRLLFALDRAAGTADVTVNWPGGGADTFHGLSLGMTHMLVEAQGTPHAAP